MIEDLMSPLGKDHCKVFNIIGIVFFVLALMTFIGIIYTLVAKNINKESRGLFILYGVIEVLLLLFSYYIYRIFYSMCKNSLN
jgi:hypothetical protein